MPANVKSQRERIDFVDLFLNPLTTLGSFSSLVTFYTQLTITRSSWRSGQHFKKLSFSAQLCFVPGTSEGFRTKAIWNIFPGRCFCYSKIGDPREIKSGNNFSPTNICFS